MLKHSVHASKYFFARTLKSQPVKKTDGAEFRHPDIPCFEVMRLSLEAGVFFASYYVQIPILPLSFSQHKNVAFIRSLRDVDQLREQPALGLFFIFPHTNNRISKEKCLLSELISPARKSDRKRANGKKKILLTFAEQALSCQ